MIFGGKWATVLAVWFIARWLLFIALRSFCFSFLLFIFFFNFPPRNEKSYEKFYKTIFGDFILALNNGKHLRFAREFYNLLNLKKKIYGIFKNT